MDIGPAIVETAYAALNKALELSVETRQLISSDLYLWLSQKARKIESLDMPEKLKRMQQKLDQMMGELKLTVNDKGLAMSAQSAESTLVLSYLTRGSEWFEPHPNLGEAVLRRVSGTV